jgi:Zn-dependent protease
VFNSDTSVTLGRLSGVPVRIGPGAALLAGALTVLLGSRWVEAGAGPEAYALSALAAVGFLASILVHEASHAVVARRHGLSVSEIRLVLLGGMARLEGQARSPRAEMAIAAAGPLASISIAVVGVAGVAVLRSRGVDGIVGGALAWLAVINGILGVFNLLPGLPLDGGRILTGFLWSRSGDRVNAVQSAAKVGRFLGLALIAVGAAELVLLRSLTGLWTAVVGHLLVSSSRAEAGHARMVGALRGYTVGQAMAPEPATVALGTRSIVARALLPRPGPQQRWAVAVDEAGIARGLVDLVALDRLADVHADEPVDAVVLPVDHRRAAYAREDLEEVLGRVEGLPLVVIDERWRAVGVLSHLRVQPAGPGAGPVAA